MSLCAPSIEVQQHELDFEVFSNLNAFNHLRSDWDDAVVELGSSIYMTFDWVRTWWEVYGEDRELRVFVCRETGGKVVAIVPIYLESFGFSVFRTTVARLVGANLPPKTFNPPVHPEFAQRVFAKLLSYLFDQDRCNLLSLGPVSSRWNGQEGFGAAVKNSALAAERSFTLTDVQTIFRLPTTFEDYLQSIGGSEKKSRLKRIRSLEKEHTLTVDVIDGAEAREEFESFRLLHAKQWQVMGKGGHFEAWPHAERFNRLLVERFSDSGRVRFFRMLVDGDPVVSRFTFALGRTIYSELPARAVGQPWDKLGIGGISLMKFNQQLIEMGVREVDSGLGGYDHKTQLGGEECQVGIWRITSAKSGSTIKVPLFLTWARVVKFTLHKLWYRRVVPRLPLRFNRSQSLYALRFDS